ncbi:glycolate oxidase subunit GlcE [Microbulbifer sediminum]|uniref:glycolate oxidase subunit GlcE n=1 Tax=Microbulbifer sediminum TaxID=2904250 RepID=UPI001F029A85|nr:glycolate oxidase subunit GlcE [Microbulbifer sediminum]
MAEHDISAELQRSVQLALANPAGKGLRIRSGNTRGHLLPGDVTDEAIPALDTGRHTGVIHYQPDELVLRARSGTPLAELESLLAEHGQEFAAAIPQPGRASTLGGAIACGWDGPARPYGMSLRDTVLGCRMVNGRGDSVNFGGQVMKNVAGYDLARLQVGALGTLGLLLDVSLRLLPRPEFSVSRVFAVPEQQLPEWWGRTRALRPLLRGTCYLEGLLHLRLCGRERAVKAAMASLGGEESALDWRALGDLRHPFFCTDQLACVNLPPQSAFRPATGSSMVEWEGARVWVRDGDHVQLQQQAREHNGFVEVFRGKAMRLPAPAREWQRRLRNAFDPEGLFNRALYTAHFHGSEADPCR